MHIPKPRPRGAPHHQMSTLEAMAKTERTTVDVVIVGGGHNGLTAAAYLAGAGLSVRVVERLDVFGGAAVSHRTFPGVEARLSRYSYLVSLLPATIINDLKLPISLAKRRYSSFTPVPGTTTGLLIDNHDDEATRASFAAIDAASDAAAWSRFYDDTRMMAEALFPTVTSPLITRSEAQDLVVRATSEDVWTRFIDEPVGCAIDAAFDHDVVKGVVLTDGLIGTFASNEDPHLDANKCFLYHVIGGGTGAWDVPVGGMGAVSGALAAAARTAGADLVSGADVTEITDEKIVRYQRAGDEHEVEASWVLVNSSPEELSRLRGHQPPTERAEGAQVKVNMLLTRLPALKDPSVTPAQAFGGTFHINETWSQLEAAFRQAENGQVPEVLPCEIYCHSLTDSSIVSPELAAAGVHTLTVFGLHAPHRLAATRDPDELREELQAAVLRSLNSVLAEAVEPLLFLDDNGNPCIETKTTVDLEQVLRLPGGNIFHGPLEWPFVEDDADLSTPAKRWGVATDHPHILMCGSGARRGGAVSGIAGHNAAMAVLESRNN